LKLLLGKLAGVLVSDRWCVYDNWDMECRQLCWAHVKRNWDKLIERGRPGEDDGRTLAGDAEGGVRIVAPVPRRGLHAE
jgi:transposase